MVLSRMKARCPGQAGSQNLLTRMKGAAAKDPTQSRSRVTWVLLHSPGWGSGWSAKKADGSGMAPRAYGAASGLCGLSILRCRARLWVQGKHEREQDREREAEQKAEQGVLTAW